MQKKNQTKEKPKKHPGYTPQSGLKAAQRNCVAGGGKWTGGKCVGGAL